MTEAELVRHLGQENTAAFDELYQRYHSRLLHYFYRMLGGNEEKAQDFLQEVFLKVIEQPPTPRSTGPFSTWIFTVAYHLCCNEYRRLQVRQNAAREIAMPLEANGQTGYHEIEKNIDQQNFRKALLHELEKLSQDQRSTFLLRFQENFSIRQISAIMGCAAGTVKSRLYYTIRFLAVRLRAFDPCQLEKCDYE